MGREAGSEHFQRMKTMVSIALLKARTRSFEAGRPGDMGNALEELSGDLREPLPSFHVALLFLPRIS